MRLRLNLGLSDNSTSSGGGNQSDWPNYTGINDGPEVQLFTDGGYGPSAGASLDDTTLFMATRHKGNGGSITRYFQVLTRDEDDITERTLLRLTDTAGIFPSIQLMSSTRVLCGWSSNTAFLLNLIDVSDLDAPVEIATDNGAGVIGSGEHYTSLHRLTDTTALMAYDDDNNIGYHVCVVDIAGDAISYGTPVYTGDSGSNYIGACVLSPTLIAVATNRHVHLYSVSGTVLSLLSSIDIEAGGAQFDDVVSLVALDDTRMVLMYEDDNATLDKIYANIYTISGGNALSRGTRIEVDSGVRVFGGPQQNGGFSPDAGTAVFVYSVNEDGGTSPRIKVVSVDDNDDLTLESSVIKNDIGDHPSLAVMEGTGFDRVVLITQDNTTTPTDQVTLIVLHGD